MEREEEEVVVEEEEVERGPSTPFLGGEGGIYSMERWWRWWRYADRGLRRGLGFGVVVY